MVASLSRIYLCHLHLIYSSSFKMACSAAISAPYRGQPLLEAALPDHQGHFTNPCCSRQLERLCSLQYPVNFQTGAVSEAMFHLTNPNLENIVKDSNIIYLTTFVNKDILWDTLSQLAVYEAIIYLLSLLFWGIFLVLQTYFLHKELYNFFKLNIITQSEKSKPSQWPEVLLSILMPPSTSVPLVTSLWLWLPHWFWTHCACSCLRTFVLTVPSAWNFFDCQ